MDYVLIALGVFFMIGGLLGCILPVIPGPPLSYVGLILLHVTEKYQYSSRFLILWAAITVAVYALDYIIPAWGTKKFSGSKRLGKHYRFTYWFIFLSSVWHYYRSVCRCCCWRINCW